MSLPECDICGRPAIARLLTEVEALDLTNWPEEFLMAADKRARGHLCAKCLRRFMQTGADVMESLDPGGACLVPDLELLPLTEDGPPIDADLDDFTDEHGNTYTRTDQGYILTEHGPGQRNVALGPGRSRPKKLN